MAIAKKEDLAKRFKNGSKPTEDDFADLIDSCYGSVSSGSLDSTGDNLLISTQDPLSGEESAISIDLSRLNQKLVYDPLTNMLRITGHFDLPQKLGYWGPNENLRHKTDVISADARVGIKTPTPEADLDVNGSLMLQFGKLVNEISSTIETENYKRALPTIEAILQYLRNRAELLMYGELDFHGVRDTGGNLIKAVESINGSKVKVELDFVILMPASQTWGQIDLAPGVYQVEVNLHIKSFKHGENTGIILEFPNYTMQYLWRTENASALQSPILSLSVPVYLTQRCSKMIIAVVAENNGKIEIDSQHGIYPKISLTRMASGMGSLMQ